MIESDIEFPKIHILAKLLDLVLPVEPLWEAFRKHLIYLTNFSVAYRYPGESADRKTALDARRRCRVFRKVAREAFGLQA